MKLSERTENDRDDASNLSIRIPTHFVQPPNRKPLLSSNNTSSDLKISIKSSLVPKTSPQLFKTKHSNNRNFIRFIAANPLNQYFKDRQSAQFQLADSLQSNSNTKTNSVDHAKHNDQDSSDDSFIYGSRSKDIETKHIKTETQTTNMIPQKRLFSSLSHSNRSSSTFEPHLKYARYSNLIKKAQNLNKPQNVNKTQNVNIWSWTASDVIEFLQAELLFLGLIHHRNK